MTMTEINFPNFKDYEKFASTEKSSNGCERVYSTLFLWKKEDTHRYFVWRDRLVVYSINDKFIQYPIGVETSSAELLELIVEMRTAGLEPDYIYDVPPNFLQKYPELEEYFIIEKNLDFFDYLYSLDKLANLTGAKLRKKRNHIKRFESENPHWCSEPVGEKNLKDVADFMLPLALSVERQAMLRAFEGFKNLNLGGVVLRGESRKIVAAALWSKINADVYCVHFEKSDKSSKGAPQTVVKLEAESLLRLGATLMNWEQDMGLPNLRRAKSSLDPEMYERAILKIK